MKKIVVVLVSFLGIAFLGVAAVKLPKEALALAVGVFLGFLINIPFYYVFLLVLERQAKAEEEAAKARFQCSEPPYPSIIVLNPWDRQPSEANKGMRIIGGWGND